MKSRIPCKSCEKLFWAKVSKDTLDGKRYVDIRDQYCQACKNRMRAKRKTTVMVVEDEHNIPDKLKVP